VRERGLDGVICGHIHWASLKEVDGLVYANCGDWVDSCSAIVEHEDGRLEMVQWSALCRLPRQEPVPDAHRGVLMRVLMVSDVYFPRINGVSTSIETFRGALAEQGIDVDLVAPDYGGDAVPG
jgi:hypothetical protein